MIYYEIFKLWKSEVVIILKHKLQILRKYTFGYVTDIIIDNIRWSTSEFFLSAIKGAHTNKNINDLDFAREMKKKKQKNYRRGSDGDNNCFRYSHSRFSTGTGGLEN